MAEAPKESTQHRVSCTECQRRKQKCNRQWPCNHCQKRKVADRCRFGPGPPPGSDAVLNHEPSRKRQLSHDEPEPMDVNPWEDAESGFEALGYSTSHLFAGLGASSTRKPKAAPNTSSQYYKRPEQCSQLNRALQLLPPRPYTDSLVQNFLNSVNFHYYIIYPSPFLQEYQKWWSLRSEDRPLGLQWTCLLLMVCACSAQYTSPELRRKLQVDLGESTQSLSERYHNAARELHGAIPVGNNHLLNVQSLLHSCYWYKSEARFVECWHVLSTAIREAQELGIHKETVTGHMPEFDREMRRRVWCILDTWDWQISSLLSRPMLIDRTDTDVGFPSLTLEGYTPSPLLFMKLQSELIAQLFARFGLPKNVVRPSEVQVYQAMVERWMMNFPSTYALTNPDTSNDMSRPWIVLHRHYLRTMALCMMLNPMRPYLAKLFTKDSPPNELKIRSDGINYTLQLMDTLHDFFDHLYPRDAKYHFLLFCIFDTAAVMCSALMHDRDLTILRRNELLAAIHKALLMLRRLSTITKTAKTSHDVLLKIASKVAGSKLGGKLAGEPRNKQVKVGDIATGPPGIAQTEDVVTSHPGTLGSHISYTTPPGDAQLYSHAVPQSIPLNQYPVGDISAAYTAAPITVAAEAMLPLSDPIHYEGAQMYYPASNYDTTPPSDDLYQAGDLGTFNAITEQDLGDLANLWNYESLDLNFNNPVVI